jgi:hypothetical protein
MSDKKRLFDHYTLWKWVLAIPVVLVFACPMLLALAVDKAGDILVWLGRFFKQAANHIAQAVDWLMGGVIRRCRRAGK